MHGKTGKGRYKIMAVVSAFCKKGGVGKTTFIGFYAHYLSKQGKKVLVLSADDQNSIFKIFGAEDKIFDQNDPNNVINSFFLEYFLAGYIELGDLIFEVRENLFLIKTMNTGKLSMSLTLERSQEKAIKKMFKEYSSWFDYIFIDFPPSSSRLTEVLLELSDVIMVVVGLDELGFGGFINTIQYFMDIDQNPNTVSYVVPTGFSKTRRAPKNTLAKLTEQAEEIIPNAVVLPAIHERSIVKNLQADGISPYDEDVVLTPYDKNGRDLLLKELENLFSKISI